MILMYSLYTYIEQLRDSSFVQYTEVFLIVFVSTNIYVYNSNTT